MNVDCAEPDSSPAYTVRRSKCRRPGVGAMQGRSTVTRMAELVVFKRLNTRWPRSTE